MWIYVCIFLLVIFLALTLVILILSNISLLKIPPSIDYKIDEIRTRWSRGCGPEVNGFDIDYSYFSPVENGADKNRKYPLIIVTAGLLNGIQEGFELIANAIAEWSTDEKQAKFNGGNAYLLIARAPEEKWRYWNCSLLTPALKAAIDDFCKANSENINTDEIHLFGWCLGASGAINLSSTYPNDFATLSFLCPNRAVTEDEAAALKNMPIWITGAKSDTYSNYKKNVLKSYERITKASNRPEDIRFTSYDKAPDIFLLDRFHFIHNHGLWYNLLCDLKTEDPSFTDMQTLDGNNNIIEKPSAIAWLNSHNLSDQRKPSEARKVNQTLKEKYDVYIKERLVKLMLNVFVLHGWL